MLVFCQKFTQIVFWYIQLWRYWNRNSDTYVASSSSGNGHDLLFLCDSESYSADKNASFSSESSICSDDELECVWHKIDIKVSG
jgi:hypothetical protein